MSNLKTILKIFAFVAIAIISLFIIALLVNIFMWSLAWGPAPNHRQMERDFQANKEQLFIVRDFLLESESQSVLIYSIDDAMLVGNDGVDDEDTLDALNHLFQNGYRVIGKGGNGVYFQRWANLDVGRGIVYSIDGNTPDESSLEFLTEIKSLSEERWYFYIEDFNEWKRRNR